MDEELRNEIAMWVELAVHKFHASNNSTVIMDDCSGESVAEIMALIDSYSREARIDEISGVQLEYGHRVAQTFVNGKAMSILDRIAELKALGGKPEGKPNE